MCDLSQNTDSNRDSISIHTKEMLIFHQIFVMTMNNHKIKLSTNGVYLPLDIFSHNELPAALSQVHNYICLAILANHIHDMLFTLGPSNKRHQYYCEYTYRE